MCTLTIRRQNNALLVTMNRDEQRIRDSERSPFLWGAPEVFAPQDTKAKGTWIGMNAAGKIVALLNGYQQNDGNIAQKTRGEIIPKILSGEEITPTLYASFHLIEITKEQIKHSHWDGQDFTQNIMPDQEWIFFTSSSWKQEAVTQARREKFQQWVGRGAQIKESLPIIHLQYDSEETEQSVLMARDDACTKSITQFEVTSDHLGCRYWPNPHETMGFEEYQGLF